MHLMFLSDFDYEKLNTEIIVPIGYDSVDKIAKEFKSLQNEVNFQYLKPKAEENRKVKNYPVSNYDEIVKKLTQKQSKKPASQEVKSLVSDIRSKRNDK